MVWYPLGMKIYTHVHAAEDGPLRLPFGEAWPEGHPRFLSVHGSVGAALSDLRTALGGLDGTAVHGATSCLGVMSDQGAECNGAIGAFAIYDDDGDYGTGAADISGDPMAASAAATEQALANAGRSGEAPDLIWISSAPGTEEAILGGVQSVVGTQVPIVGGSAADDAVQGDWQVFDRGTAYSNGVVVSVLFPSTDVSMSFQNGYAPEGSVGRLTKAEGRRIHEIDDRPAAAFCQTWGGGQATETGTPAQILSQSTFAPLGRQIGDVASVPFYLLVHPATAYPDGSIDVFADVTEGEELHLMTGSQDSLISRAGRVAQQARGGLPGDTPIAGALVVYCGGCMLAVRDRMDEAVQGINSALDHAPFLGVFTFGEQGQVLSSENR
ncbi:MAG: FIST C-terminal domain-containing protein, partial [Pseudomonadota bacterium]